MANKPTKAEYEGFKKAVANPMTPAPIKQKLQSIIDQYASEYEGGSEAPKAEPKSRAGRKTSTTKKYKTLPKPKMVALITATTQAEEDMKAQLKKLGYNPEEVDALDGNKAFAILEELKSKMVVKPKRTATPRATKKTSTDIEQAKAEIKAKTGKTEEECEAIIEQYRSLRTKAQEGKRKAEQASADNKKRVEKLDQKGDLIEGTNIKTADAVIESTAKDVAEKIEQQIEAVEEKAEKEAKAEVAKDKTIKTTTEKKEAVEAKVEKKVKEKTKVIVKKVVIDTSALLTSIATSLGKFDKDSQKEFLIKLRSDIDKLLAKYAFGGMTDGATQVMNVQQSNLSASSVNPAMFANGGGVKKSSGLNYGKKDDVYFDVVTLLNSKMQKPKGIFGQEKVQVKTMSLDSLMEYVKNYENDIRYDVDLPIELFTKESFHKYSDEGMKFKFINGKIYRLGKEELLEKKIDSYTKERGIKPPQRVLAKFEKEVQDAPQKTTIVQRIHSQQLLAKGGSVEGHKHVLHIDGQNWFLEKIDSTHFYMSNDQNYRGMAHHIGQHKGEPYYEEVREWLKTTYAKGGEVLPTRTIGDMTYKVFKDGNGYNVLASNSYYKYDVKVGKPISKVEAVKLLNSLIDRKSKGNNFANGGVIGQEIVFDDNGEENSGVIKDITNLGDYVVKADDGRTLLAQRDLDVISFGAMRQQGVEQRKKRFGFFDEGGNVSDLDYSDILAVLEDKLTDSVQELPNSFENSYNAEGEEVEHQSRDGFIAFTDGGFEVRWFETLSGFYGAGYSLPTKALENEKNRQIDLSLEDAKDYFKGEYPEIVEELGEENIDYNSLYEAGYESEAEELSETEMDMMDGTIMCEIGAYYYTPNNDRGIEGQHTLRLFGLVNLESPYHRSGNLEDRYDYDITFDSIEELAEKVDEGLKAIIDWFNGSHYFKSTEELRIRRMAKGGMTEHGLRVGDEIMGESKDLNAVFVKNKDEWHNVFIDKGLRYAKGGKLWIDTKGKGGLKGVKPSRKNTFRNEAVKRNMTSGQLASKVLASPSRYKGINPRSAQLVKNMGVRKQGGSIGDILRNRRGQ